MPFDGRSVLGFEVAILIDTFFCITFLYGAAAFFLIYFSICTNIWSCIDDMSFIVERLNANIDNKIGVKEKIKQFLAFHLDFYGLVFFLEKERERV